MTYWNTIILTRDLDFNKISWQKEKFSQWQKYLVQQVGYWHFTVTCTALPTCTVVTWTFTTVYIHHSHRGWLALSNQLSVSKTNLPRPSTWDEKHRLLKASVNSCKMASCHLILLAWQKECSLIKGNTLHRMIHMYSVKLCRESLLKSLLSQKRYSLSDSSVPSAVTGQIKGAKWKWHKTSVM